jgi:hypothetical protein
MRKMSSTTMEKTVSATEMESEFINRGRPNDDFLKATSAMSENLGSILSSQFSAIFGGKK